MTNHRISEKEMQKRRTKKLMRAIESNLTKLEDGLNAIIKERVKDFRDSLKICECCGIPYIEIRSGSSRFCSDICRTSVRNGAKDESQYGCWLELDCGDIEGPYPDCVLDQDRHEDCVYAEDITKKEHCRYWKINDYEYENH